MKDYVAERGGAALGARLRRLSATIDADAARIYAAMGITFEQRWFGVLNQLALNGPMTVSDLAGALGITHVSISQTRQSLEKAGFVIAEQDRGDARRRKLALSKAGQKLVAQLRPLWSAFDEAAQELDTEAGQVTKALTRLEQALARRSLLDRVVGQKPARGPYAMTIKPATSAPASRGGASKGAIRRRTTGSS